MAYIENDLPYTEPEYAYASQCCSAQPAGEVSGDEHEPLGFCSQCYDHAVFTLADFGEPWDTKEERYGLR